jgi:hypothetical protein
MEFCKGEKENRFSDANLLDMHEWEAPESNNTVALIELTGNVPNTISGAFCASSRVTWLTCPFLWLKLLRCGAALVLRLLLLLGLLL